VAEARGEVTEPQEETDARAQGGLIAALGKRPAPSPAIESLCADIRRAIAARRPPDEGSLLRSDPEQEARSAGGEPQSSVQSDADNIRSDYERIPREAERVLIGILKLDGDIDYDDDYCKAAPGRSGT
jgi:hypothetical protein